MTTGELAVWLYGQRVALVTQARGRMRLSYTEEALRTYALGTPLLSLALPLRPEPYTHGLVRPFLDGLLPEGEPRQVLARGLRLVAGDTLALIAALGRDCAGALVIQPAVEPAPPPATALTAEPLDEKELEDLVRDLRSAPLGVGGDVRVSLAGVQEKLLLTRMPDGRWGRPVAGTPSTHILKPEIDRFPKTVENEFFCMRLAHHLGLRVPSVEAATVGKRRVIIVERYDRLVEADGTVERIHQEDLCQATGTPPERKYEQDGGPSLRRMAEMIAAVAPPGSLEDFLRAVTVNVLVGNGDAHAKNYSLVHERNGRLRLSPTYDVLSTMFYEGQRLAAYVDGVQRSDRVTGDRLLNEASRWGMSRSRAREIVEELFERYEGAVAAASGETDGLPPEIPQIIETQLSRLRMDLYAARV
ncbi:MAG: type II toxin-antitoxin system HipA family toxin [Chloroflexota bacterium]|nr:type II toxin-antitoxin system HipA family toxin [Chloroflexota bacterium]